MTNLHELFASLAEIQSKNLRALASHLNHDQITGALESLADDADALAALLREAEQVADAVLPDSTPDTTAAPKRKVRDQPQA